MKREFLINLILYMCFLMGCVLIMWDEIELLIIRIKLRHKLKALKVEKKTGPAAILYLEGLIDNRFPSESSRRLFYIFELMLFIVSYFLAIKNFGYLSAAGISLISAAMPVIFLAARLESSRSKASREGISMMTELYRQYRINNLNIYEAIESTVNSEGDYKLLSKKMFRLLIRLRSACGIIETREAIDSFCFSVGTSWAKMLGICIRLSAEKGCDVSSGLYDIATQLKEANNLEEKRRMMNSEASRMSLLLVPIMYFACMAAAVFYLGIEPKHLLQNQFLNPKGYLLLLLIIFLFLINYLLLFILSNSKLDY